MLAEPTIHRYVVDTRIPFVGRDGEMNTLQSLLSARASATLVGPGGVGKSRLALESARRWSTLHAAPVTFVGLVGVAPEEIAGTVAYELKLPRTPGRSSYDVLDDAALAANHTIVLDNCEDAPGSVRVVIERLRHHPGVAVLATSRVPLRYDDERIVEIAPFSESDACAFFAARAAVMQVPIDLGGKDADAVRTIVAKVDGLAVAIDLAAARLASLTVRELAAELENPRPYHFRSSASSEPRHWSLNHVVDWSLSKMGARSAEIFALSGRFANAYTAGDVAALCGTASEKAAAKLDELVERSLVLRTERPNEYSMLAPIRAVAKQRFSRLRNRRDLEKAYARHMDALADDVISNYQRNPSATAVLGAAGRYDDFVAVLSWALEEPAERAALAIHVFGALVLVWSDGGRFSEGMAWCDRFLEVGSFLEARDLGRMCYNVLRVAHAAGEFQRMIELGPRLISAFTMANDRLGLARAYNALSVASLVLGMPDAARTYVATSLALYRSVDHPFGIMSATVNEGNVALDGYGDTATARACYERAIDLAREVGSEVTIALATANLANAALFDGDLDATERYATLALEYFTTMGNDARAGWMHQYLARVRIDRGDLGDAARELRESLDLLERQPNPEYFALFLETCARFSIARGNDETAAVMLLACRRFRTERNVPATGTTLKDTLADTARVEAQLDAERMHGVAERAASIEWPKLGDLARQAIAEI